MPKTTWTIPFDICLDLVDAVGADPQLRYRRSTLRACALTCSAWLGRARAQLYNNVSFRADCVALRKFSHTIAASPELGALVRHIDITFWLLNFDADDYAEETGPFNPDTMRHLPNLRSIQLHDPGWSSDPQLMGILIRRLSRAASVRSLSLRGAYTPNDVTDLTRCLEQFPHISSLEISVAYWEPDEGPPAEETSSVICQSLTRLTLWEPRLFFPLLQVFPSTVKILELGPPYYDELEVVPEPVEDNFRALSRYTSLEVLKLTTQLPLYDTDADWFLDALSHVQAPQLRELYLEYRRKSYETSIRQAHWQALDEVLSGWSGSGLRRVSVKIDPSFFPDATRGEDDLEQAVLALFNKCTKRHIEVVPNFSTP
ncbi:hypothetical protein VTO73DRAFT_7815 [Trametes versicolor]